MIIKTAEFIKSSEQPGHCPKSHLPEFAFIGRSNVGKSSLINMLTGKKNLAKISRSPGKTKLINHFIINGSWYLVDLPGYGFARAGQKERELFFKRIHDYILNRKQLFCVFVLLDIRISPQPVDKLFINWLGHQKIPFVLVFTKTDKLNQKELNAHKNQYFDHLYESWEILPDCFFSSTIRKTGRDEILNFIEESILSIKNDPVKGTET